MGPHSHVLQPSKSLMTQPDAQACGSTCSTRGLQPLHMLNATQCLTSVHALSTRAAAVLQAPLHQGSTPLCMSLGPPVPPSSTTL